MNRLAACTALLLACLLLGGCYNYSEMEDTVMVAGFAVDTGISGKAYTITAELIDTEGENVSGKTVQVQGDNLIEALRSMVGITSKKLNMSHCVVVILSEEIARQDILPILDVIFRDHEIRMSMQMFVARTPKAADILAAKPMEGGVVSFSLQKALHSTAKSQPMSTQAKLYQVMDSLAGEGKDPLLPACNIVPQGETPTVQLEGSAVFVGQRLAGYITQEQTKYAMLVNRKSHGGLIDFSPTGQPNSHLSAEVFATKVRVHPAFTSGGVSFSIEVESIVGLNELAQGIDLLTQEGRAQAEAEIARAVEQGVQQMLQGTRGNYRADILGLGREIYNAKPATWQQFKPGWRQQLPSLPVEVKAKVHIRSSGYSPKQILAGSAIGG